MRNRTKIVATLGPATDEPKILGEMMDAGLNLARFNFSHGGQEQQKERLLGLREVAEGKNRVIGVIGDLQGPKIRVRRFENSSVTLGVGDSFFIDSSLGGARRRTKTGSASLMKICTRMSVRVTCCS